MRIFIDNSGPGLCNMGDLAMLQVGLSRLSEIFPGAQLDVLTTKPRILESLHPGAQSVVARGRTTFFFNGTLLGQRLHRRWPRLEEKMRLGSPALTLGLVCMKKRMLGQSTRDMQTFMRAFGAADLAICTGGGFINDTFRGHARHILEQLALGARQGKPTALFGQGIGPLTNAALLEQMRDWLPLLKLITLREGLVGPSLLRELGFPSDRTIITGDDAIELAHAHTPAQLGTNLGVNVRVAHYSGMDETHLAVLREVLLKAAQIQNAGLLPVPISHCNDSRDALSIARLIGGDGGESLQTPREVIEQVGRCRVVVTGSYHAGVFALSQGVSVVALSKSAYYDDKFNGLSDQFGGGCTLVSLEGEDFSTRLQKAIAAAWENAPEARAGLLDAAQRQIESGRAAYARLRDFV